MTARANRSPSTRKALRDGVAFREATRSRVGVGCTKKQTIPPILQGQSIKQRISKRAEATQL